ncbi:ComEC/Rec2-related protein [Thermophagus xiamenensis]|uniref:ComEC/Rec2-related protein n=1 Tax=Thermophagus xiamenensis TaxID=385682 RepID=A0A1I1V966_9BACT|nr:ComEC/Rec2-related protein [Thermophagus xiamenensis]
MVLLDYFKRVPFLRFVLALALGIYGGNIKGSYGVTSHFLLLAILFIVLLVFHFSFRLSQKYSLRWVIGALFLLFLFYLGFVSGHLSRATETDKTYRVKALGRVQDAFVTQSGYWRVFVRPMEIEYGDSIPISHTDSWLLFVKSTEDSLALSLSPGDVILFDAGLKGTMQSKVNPEAFDYGKYLFRQGISFSGFVDKNNLKVLERKPSLYNIRSLTYRIRNRIIEIYKAAGIQGRQLQLLSALTLGMRYLLDDEVKEWFIRAGVIHVLAVSGLHVGIVFLMFKFIADWFLPKNNWARLILVIAGLWFYAFLTGGAPSVFRAVIMLSLVQVGNFLGRRTNIYNLLSLSAFIILIIQPNSIFHVGFWLSHLAVAGIATFYPLFRKLYSPYNILIRPVCDLMSVSLSAQLGTLALSLHIFKAFPCWFLLSGFLILPVVGPVLFLSMVLVLVSKSSFLSKVFSGALNDLLTYMIEMTQWLDRLPYAYVSGIHVSFSMMVLIYLFIANWAGWIYLKKRILFLLSLLFLVIIVGMLNATYIRKRTTGAFVVFYSMKDAYIGLINNGAGELYHNASTYDNADFIYGGFFTKYAIEMEEKTVNQTEDAEILMFPTPEGVFLGLSNVNLSEIKVVREQQDEIKGVVIYGKIRGNLLNFLKQIGCFNLIVTGNVPRWQVEKWEKLLDTLDGTIHYVPDKGAYVEFFKHSILDILPKFNFYNLICRDFSSRNMISR